MDARAGSLWHQRARARPCPGGLQSVAWSSPCYHLTGGGDRYQSSGHDLVSSPVFIIINIWPSQDTTLPANTKYQIIRNIVHQFDPTTNMSHDHVISSDFLYIFSINYCEDISDIFLYYCEAIVLFFLNYSSIFCLLVLVTETGYLLFLCRHWVISQHSQSVRVIPSVLSQYSATTQWDGYCGTSVFSPHTSCLSIIR